MKAFYFAHSKQGLFVESLSRLTIVVFCLLSALQSRAQPYYNQQQDFIKANSVWAFGTNAGLDFNSGTPVAIETFLWQLEGSAAVASPITGQLLFYSNGDQCLNANNQLMPNGDNLPGGLFSALSATQGTCIVPMINDTGKYYLFSLKSADYATPSLVYSVIDMALDNGLGDVVPGKKGIVLNTDTLSESMIAIPGSDCDIWLMVHAYAKPQFIAYHITRNGLDTVPVISSTGPAMQGTFSYQVGGAAVSPNRQLVAIASKDQSGAALPPPGNWGAVVAQFDPATGMASNGIKVIGDTVMCLSVCFSPDNSKLYVTSSTVGGARSIYQFDVSVFNAAAISNSATLVASSPSWGLGTFGMPWLPFLKLYRDTIYAATTPYGPFLDRINQPNLAGSACGFQADAVSLFPGTNCQFALNTEVVYPIPPDTIAGKLLDTLICTVNQSGYSLPLYASPGYYSYEWDDGSTNVTRTIATSGSYWVLCKDSCHSRIDTFIVKQGDITFSLGNDTLICDPNASLTLEVAVPDATYLWPDGSTGSRYTARGTGDYWVTVSVNGCKATDSINVIAASFEQDLGPDFVLCKETPANVILQASVPPGSSVLWSTGSSDASIIAQDTGYYWVSVSQPPCSGTDTLHIANEVCECIFLAPSAFSPNGDGLNDELLPQIISGCDISNFMFSIFNRYGQRVFTSTRPEKGWNGTMNGQPADAGTYFFELSFKGGRDKNNYYKKGDVTLVR